MNMPENTHTHSTTHLSRWGIGMALFLSTTLLLPLTASAKDIDFPSYDAVYKSRISGLNVKMKRSLSKEGQRYALSMKAKKMMFGIRDHCEFDYDGSSDAVKSAMYKHTRKGMGKRHNKHMEFDWEANQARDLLHSDRPAHDLEFPTFDKLCHQAQFRLDLLRAPVLDRYEYKISNGSTGKDYAYDRVGEEVLETPAGKLNTIKFKRDRGSSERQTFIWVAKDWSYLIVRIDQIESKDKKPETLSLVSASIDGTEVTGLGG